MHAATKTSSHRVVGRGYLRALGRTRNAGFTLDRSHVTYVDNAAGIRFRSVRVSSVGISGHTATLRGTGTLNGKRVAFTVVAMQGTPDRLAVALGRYAHRAAVVRGFIRVR